MRNGNTLPFYPGMKLKRVWIAGQYGMVGSAISRQLRLAGYDLIPTQRHVPDLLQLDQTIEFALAQKPELIVMAAGRVGGIVANSTRPVEFLVDNARMVFNLLEAAHKCDARKVLYLGSSCIYPRLAPQPMRPEYLLSSPLEPTNEGYALAKIAGVRLCQYYRREYQKNFVAAMPCNLYGQGDTYDATDSHVIPALMVKFHAAKTQGEEAVLCLGDGSAQREFLYVEDLARAAQILIERYDGEQLVNIGSSLSYSIAQIARLVADTVEFQGEIKWDGKATANGMPIKVMDSTPMRELGWEPRISLETGLHLAYHEFKERFDPAKVIQMDDEPTGALRPPQRA